jgi:hypothetical protein
VTIIAAYADPCHVLFSRMIPALDHGSSPGRMFAVLGPVPARARGPEDPFGNRPVSEVTRTVMLPFPSSGWRTK